MVKRVLMLNERELRELLKDLESDRAERTVATKNLAPMSMEARKPIFQLKPADGAIGAHVQAVQRSYLDFEGLAKRILEATGTENAGHSETSSNT